MRTGTTGVPMGEMTGVVLAGGKSRRMGKDKRFLDVAGRPSLEHVCAILAPLFPEVILSLAHPEPEIHPEHFRVVTDVIPDCAAMGGLYTALSGSSHSRIFVVACDMPFITALSIQRFLGLVGECDVGMVELTTGLQPMHAVYSKACLPAIRRMIDQKHLKIQTLATMEELNVRILKEKELGGTSNHMLPFLNINTPADYELVRKLLADSQQERH
jgi:molybdopterin-guanine dinucleotide biosynthesis protein A